MLHFEYLHKDDVAILVWELKDQELHLCYSDEKGCELIGTEYPLDDCRCMKEFFQEDLYYKLLSVCSQLGPTYEVFKLHNDESFRGAKIPLYLTIAYCKINERTVFFVYCTESDNPISHHLSNVSEELNKAIYNASFDVLFTLHLTHDQHLLLVNYNKSFLSYFGRLREHYEYFDLMTLLPPTVVSYFTENTKLALSQGMAFSRLLEYEYTEEECKLYLTPSRKKFSLLTTFLPLSIKEYHSVLCCSRDIASEMDAKNEACDLLEEYNALFTATANAVAIFSCDDPFHPVLERENQRMRELIQQVGTLSYTDLFVSKVWSKVMKTRQSEEAMLSLQPNGQPLHFKIIVIPIIRNGVLVKAIISIIDTTDQVITNVRNSIKLSNREEEIISYVLAGEKNDFIAAKLCVSVGTVKRTLSNAYSKLGLSSRVELLNYYHSKNYNTIKPNSNN